MATEAEMIRLVTLGIIWFVGMVGGMLIALSKSDWTERFAARIGDDPEAGGRALRFFVMCLGTFIVPMLHIMAWEILTYLTSNG
jgi:hypothetical protein